MTKYPINQTLHTYKLVSQEHPTNELTTLLLTLKEATFFHFLALFFLSTQTENNKNQKLGIVCLLKPEQSRR